MSGSETEIVSKKTKITFANGKSEMTEDFN